MQFEEFAVVGQLRQVLFVDEVDSVGKAHIAVAVMMAVGFAVSGDVHELGTGAIRRKSSSEAGGEAFAAIEQAFKGDRLRQRSIVEKKSEIVAGREDGFVGAGRIDASATAILPVRRADLADERGLIGREYRVQNAVLGQKFERLDIDRGLGQPHAFGLAPEAMDEVGDAPDDLGLFVARIRQRHDHVMVCLGDCVAMTSEVLTTFLVGVENAGIGFRIGAFQPAHQSGADVEADGGVVVDDADDAVFFVENAGQGVGRVTLGGDPLVPIVERVGGVLKLDYFKPGVFARRLVEMTVYANIIQKAKHSNV